MTAAGTGPAACVALHAERVALRRARTPVIRTGMGPRAAARAVPRLVGRPVLVAGVAGGLGANVRPGDLVVATEVRGPSGQRWPCPSAPLLAAELRRHGLTVHLGPLVSRPRVVDGAARRQLAETGALAVDTESAWLAAGGGPFAVLRAIVDTGQAPLWRPGTLARGSRALRTLTVAVPAIDAWAGAARARRVLLVDPRSFRAGVQRAIDVVAPAEAARIAGVQRSRFPASQPPPGGDIRYAPTNGRRAVSEISGDCDLMLVLGSANSSNSVRLVEVARRAGVPARLVDDAAEVDLGLLAGAGRIGVTAGASAPPGLVDELVGCLSGLGPVAVEQSSAEPENMRFTQPENMRFTQPENMRFTLPEEVT